MVLAASRIVGDSSAPPLMITDRRHRQAPTPTGQPHSATPQAIPPPKGVPPTPKLSSPDPFNRGDEPTWPLLGV